MSDRERSRRLLIKRTIAACGALFGTLFVLLSVQMVLGRDPALGSREGDGSATQSAQVREPSGATHERSIVDRVLSLATQALSEHDDASSSSSGNGSANPHTQAPLQSTTS